jgi:hypothetical protein
MEQNNYCLTLTHHGIKGMKWGIRRSKAKLRKANKKADRRDWSEDARVAAEIKTKSVKQMTNAELQKLNTRTQLEQTYALNNQKQKSAGRKFLESVLTEVGKEIAKEVGKEVIGAPLKDFGIKNGKKYRDIGMNFLKSKRAG